MRLSPEEYRRVRAFFEKAVAAEPTRWAYWYDIGFCCGRLGQWREAAVALERLVDRTEASVAVLGMLAHAYIKLERYHEAMTVLAKARAQAPFNLNVLYTMAVVHFHCGDIALALSPLQEVIRKRPKHVNAQFSLGLICHRLGRREAALGQLAILKELDQNFADRLDKIIQGS